jgi:hypothetical protein
MTEDLAVTLARVEGKLDAYSARTTAVEERVAELDARLRASASVGDVADLDVRVRAVETRPVVTPAGLLAAIVAAVTVVGGLVAFVQALVP